MLDDDARYQCQVSTGILGEPAIRSRFATLTVLVPPDPPRIVQGDTLYTTEDREIELECISANGKPPAEVRILFIYFDDKSSHFPKISITKALFF